MSVQENTRIDEEFIAAWNIHNPDRAIALLSDDATWRDVGSSKPLRKAEIREYLQNWFTAFPDLKAVVKNRVVTDDQIAAEIEFTGTNTGPLQMMPDTPAIPPTGKKVMSTGTYFVRVRNGKGVEVHNYPDGAGLMKQLGLMPSS